MYGGEGEYDFGLTGGAKRPKRAAAKKPAKKTAKKTVKKAPKKKPAARR
jgi:hypothetical protein